VVASLVWLGSEYQINGHQHGFIMGLLTILTGLLMVSNFRYNSFKEVDWKGKVNFLVVLLIVLVFVVVASSPAELLAVIFLLYACSGPFTTIRSVKKLKLEHVVGDDHDADFDLVTKDSGTKCSAPPSQTDDIDEKTDNELSKH
jgi:CDP-diacylglycerol---serine O-phosphatidyltransferase